MRHYKSLGLDYLLTRNHALASRLTRHDRARGWSTHYLRDDDSIRAQFHQQLAQARPVPLPQATSEPAPGEKRRWWKF